MFRISLGNKILQVSLKKKNCRYARLVKSSSVEIPCKVQILEKRNDYITNVFSYA
jgi:hypothetical protein